MRSKKEKIVLGIVGEIAAGKGELAQYVEKKYGGSAYRSSEVLRDILKRMYLPETRENVQEASMMIREFFGEDIISKVNSEDIKESRTGIVAIDGLRRKEDFKYFQKEFNFKVIYVDADIEKRFARISKRSENQGDRGKTFQEFKRDHQKETEKKIRGLKKTADYVVENNGTLREFRAKIEKIMENIINNKQKKW